MKIFLPSKTYPIPKGQIQTIHKVVQGLPIVSSLDHHNENWNAPQESLSKYRSLSYEFNH